MGAVRNGSKDVNDRERQRSGMRMGEREGNGQRRMKEVTWGNYMLNLPTMSAI